MKKFILKYTAGLFAAVLLCVGAFAVPAAAEFEKVEAALVGGTPFGIKLYADGVCVAGVADVETNGGSVSPARDSGILKGDIILKLNHTEVKSAEQLSALVESSEGALQLTVRRGDDILNITATPALSSDGKKRLGIWLRDAAAGIGTVTFVVPETGEFAGLGHGVCDSETGELVPLSTGTVGSVKISGVKRGQVGLPGEIKGYFTGSTCGNVLKNTTSGVFGVFTAIPHELSEAEVLPIGEREDVSVGDAYIYSTVDGSRRKYEIEITALPEDSGTSSFEISVTDGSLIEKTGGIVQGMSGSPIIQNGKLVGAVTHV